MQSLRKWLSSAAAPSPSYQGILFRDALEQREFNLRVQEVEEWCTHRLHSDGSASMVLRSAELKPDLMEGDGCNAAWNHEYKDVRATVSRLNEHRSKLLGQIVERSFNKAGKLLVFWPEETLDCGAAQAVSRGYFDLGNAPPWDTWFWYAELYNEPPALISWVPNDLVHVVDLGISAVPEQCIKWL